MYPSLRWLSGIRGLLSGKGTDLEKSSLGDMDELGCLQQALS